MSDGGSRVKRYILQMKEDRASSPWQDIGSVESYRNTFTVKDLEPGKNYLFAVSAENDAGVSEPTLTEKPVSPKKALGELTF